MHCAIYIAYMKYVMLMLERTNALYVCVSVRECVCVYVCVCVTSKAFGEETTQGAYKALLANNATKHVFSHCLWRPYYVSTLFVFKCIHRLYSESLKIFGTLESKKSLRFES
jgi:hypothetical protein